MVAIAKRGATYQDVLDAPPHQVAEILGGELVLSPRPAGGHSSVAAILGEELGPPFRRGRGGPGGWMFLIEPELHLGGDVVVPDLAGWRRERAPRVDVPFFAAAPDWLCEVLSPSTERSDRGRKMAIYARAGVGHLWLANPDPRTLEVYRRQDSSWLHIATYTDEGRARVEPFDAIELDVTALWFELDQSPPP